MYAIRCTRDQQDIDLVWLGFGIFFFILLSVCLPISFRRLLGGGGGMRLKRFSALLLLKLKDGRICVRRPHYANNKLRKRIRIRNSTTTTNILFDFLCVFRVRHSTRWFVCNFSVTYVVHGDDAAAESLSSSCESHSVYRYAFTELVSCFDGNG